MAAGFRYSGGVIGYASSTEWNAINQIIEDKFGSCWQCRGVLKQGPLTNCGTGRSGTVQSTDPIWKQYQYLNSCETTNMLATYETRAWVVGAASVVAGLANKVAAAFVAMFAGYCVIQRIWIGAARDNSPVKAIVILTAKPRDIYELNGTRRTYTDVKIASQ